MHQAEAPAEPDSADGDTAPPADSGTPPDGDAQAPGSTPRPAADTPAGADPDSEAPAPGSTPRPAADMPADSIVEGGTPAETAEASVGGVDPSGGEAGRLAEQPTEGSVREAAEASSSETASTPDTGDTPEPAEPADATAGPPVQRVEPVAPRQERRTAPPERAPDVDLPPTRSVLPAPGPTPPVRRRAFGPIGRRTAALSVVLVGALAVAGAGAAVLTRGSEPAVPRPTAGPAASSAPAVPGATPLPPAPAVLPGLDPTAPVPTTAGLRRVLGPLLRTAGLGGSVSAEVVDLSTGASLLAVAPTRPAVPASSAKLLTGAAALSLLGPGGRLPTTVVDGATPDEVVIVGGGDVTLAAGRGTPGSATGRAGMADLAAATAAALKAQGRSAVAVRLDDTLFGGAPVNPRWSSGDVQGGFVAPVMALAVNSGSATPTRPLVPGEPADRVDDPAVSAAQLFARLLRRQGITVTGPVARAQAPEGAATLAKVESATVADLVEHALTDSDNTVAEALARVVAVRSGRQATFSDAGVAVLDRVDLLGVPVAGARLSGGSGLGGGNAVPARTLARLLVLAASPDHPELRPLLTGLPVAGASGTLADRFTGARDRPGVGVVRAKTGTLTGASSLTGTVVDADGRMLGFVIEADAVSSTLSARAALDAAAAALARCGCR